MDLFKIEDCDMSSKDVMDKNGITLEKANLIFKKWLAKQKLDLKEKIEDQEIKIFDFHDLYEVYGDLVDL